MLFIPQDRYTSAAELAYSHLRREIIAGRLGADASIGQMQIANELGISRVPVRDALQRLEAEGLITVLPNRRAVVTRLALTDLSELFDMRAVLEGLCARRAVAKLTSDDFRELEALAAAMREAENTQTYLTKHETFHGLLAERSGMPRLRRELVRLRQMVMPYIRILGTDRTAELRSYTHSGLVQILRSGDADKVDEAFCRHVRCAFEEMENAIDSLRDRSQSVGSVTLKNRRSAEHTNDQKDHS